MCVAPKLSLTAINKLSLTAMKILDFAAGGEYFPFWRTCSLRQWRRGQNILIIRINKKD